MPTGAGPTPNGSGGNTDTCKHHLQASSACKQLTRENIEAAYAGGLFSFKPRPRAFEFLACRRLACRFLACRFLASEFHARRFLPQENDPARSAGIGPPVDPTGRRPGIGGETFDQFDNFRSLPGRKFDEGSEQSQTFDRLARWRSKLLSQIGNKRAIHSLALAFWPVDQVESMPRNNSAGKENRLAEAASIDGIHPYRRGLAGVVLITANYGILCSV